MDELWNRMATRLAETVSQTVETRLRRFVNDYCRSELKVVFTEREAAQFLGVSLDTLQTWRKQGWISYTRYPQKRSDSLSDMYSYDVADLMNFRDRYKVRATGEAGRYRIAPVVTLAGPSVEGV